MTVFSAFLGVVMRRGNAQTADASERFQEALRICDISREKAALHMEMSRTHLEQQLRGDGHLSLYRIALMPDDFISTLAALTLRDKGLPSFLRGMDAALLADKATREVA